MKKIKFILLSLLLLSTSILAQYNQYEAEYDWFTIEGENIYVHYHEGAERTAKVIAKIADEVWEPITTLYGYEPDKVHYVIKDKDDYSNGATYFFDNKIEIWASALDFDLRGTHNWLRNVISHEFTHMVQIFPMPLYRVIYWSCVPHVHIICVLSSCNVHFPIYLKCDHFLVS